MVVKRTAAGYSKLTQEQHIYKRGEVYIGTCRPVLSNQWFFNVDTRKMVYGSTDFTPACVHIFNEILANAMDNVTDSRVAGVDPGKIDIQMTNKSVSITNYGLPIPVEMHPEYNEWAPKIIFGYPNTSSHYVDDRGTSIGVNGLGAKATNIFSLKFIIVIYDGVRNKRYQQEWTDNMTNVSEASITDYEGTQSSTQIIYNTDFERFGLKVPDGNEGGYTPDAISLFAKIAVNASLTSKVPVMFNGHLFEYANITDYAKLFVENITDKNSMVHYEYSRKKDKTLPTVELLVIDAPGESFSITFANHSNTTEGGIHLDNTIKSISESTIKLINDKVIKRLVKQNKGKELDAKEKRNNLLKPGDVSRQITVFLNVQLENARLEPQVKTKLTGPDLKINLTSANMKTIQSWSLMDRLETILSSKQDSLMSKSDGKTKGRIGVCSGDDANFASGSRRNECILCLTEGKSGAGYANKLVDIYPGGRDIVGVLPLRGKGLNVRNPSNRFKIDKNKEIIELKKMLGLVEKTDYSIDANFKKLRYGGVMIMADADVDGLHIIGLILNYFDYFFQSLLKRGYIMFYRTPIIRVTYHGNSIKFYTEGDYDTWKSSTANVNSWQHKYYKGLGSSDDIEVRDDWNTKRIVEYFYDDRAEDRMQLAFNSEMANRRKRWLAAWNPTMKVENIVKQHISKFIDNEFIHFSLADIQRSIPKLSDGFKESLRKVIHGCFAKWKISSGKTYTEVKVKQLAPFISEKVGYRHNDDILGSVIIDMTQDFTGSNNVSWFIPRGQFGTRYQGGSDAAAPRYVFVKPKEIMSKIIRHEDLDILDYIVDEGVKVEPKTYYPIIPTILVNGAVGIGTGHSTSIPNFYMIDVINWLRAKINDEELPKFNPWYDRFQGTITIIPRKTKVGKTVTVTAGTSTNIISYQAEDIELIDDRLPAEINEFEEVKIPTKPLTSMLITGKYTVEPTGRVIVTELPIGHRPDHYKDWLEKLVSEKKIDGFRNLCGHNSIYFEIDGFKLSGANNYGPLKLRRTYGLSNMVALNELGVPVKYDDHYHILETFYSIRLPIYTKRKQHIIGVLNEQIVKLNQKLRFIIDIVNDDIVVVKRNKSDIKMDMTSRNHPHHLLDEIRIANCTNDEINSLKEKISNVENNLSEIESISEKTTWLNELNELECEYNKMCKQRTKNEITNQNTSKSTRKTK
jgi:DNA topoisomerase-2